MQVVRTRAALRAALATAPRPVGLVPTMGWLHAGHVSLVERARAESATVVMSIFVNPKQFGESADFEQYPRNEARDLAAAEAPGVDIVFAPTVDEVYPPGFEPQVSVGAIAAPLEGEARPGHFDGVATVVAILFAPRRRGAGLLRAQGLPAGPGHPADGPRSRAAHRGGPLRDGPRPRWPGDVVAERAPDAGRARCRVRAPPGPGRGGRGDSRPASGAPMPSVARSATCSRASPWPRPTTCRSRTPTPSRSSRRSARETLLSLAVRIDGVRLIDNERVTAPG